MSGKRSGGADEPAIGDKVTWSSSAGTSTGKVVKKVTSPTKVKGHRVAATGQEPQFIVESGKTGAKAAHKPSALKPA